MSVAIFVPSLAKLLLTTAFTPPGDQETPAWPSKNTSALNSDLSLNTVEFQEAFAAPKAQVGEIAFAARLVETAPRPQQTPAAIPGSAPEPVTTLTLPQPREQRATSSRQILEIPQPRADAPTQRTSNASGDGSSIERSVLLYPAPQPPVPREVSSSLTSRSIENTPQSPTIDHLAKPFEPLTASPLNEITVRIANPDQTSASIQMIDRSGELRIAVRSSDPQLADSLRGNVEQLTSRLNNDGWSAEVWKPAEVTPAARTHSPSQESPHGQPDPRHEPGQFLNRDQNNKQKYPDWVEEFYADNE